MNGLRKISRFISQSLRGLGATRSTVAALVFVIITLFVIPLPAFALDILLSLNITIALAILFRGLLVGGDRRFQSFPALLLLTTLFRLGLNVSSTRRILLYGDQGTHVAGEVIQSFGNFVVAGDFVVGAIIFIVIGIVNLFVIARGSARVAEVAARFTLDALPGRQLAIDADLRAGNLTREQASVRRAALTEESQFYGSMDGAMKFVQGDAVATLVIAAVNAIGGVAIGVSRGLAVTDAVNTFGVLAIGDGLVSILPALLISVASGIVVTNIAGSDGRNSRVVTDVISEPIVVVLSAMALIVASVLPGLPFIPFFAIGAGILVWAALRSEASKGQGNGTVLEIDQASPGTPSLAMRTRSLLLEIDRSTYTRFEQEGEITGDGSLRVFAETQADTYRKRGLVLGDLVVQHNRNLNEGEYKISIRERLTRSGNIPEGDIFVVGGSSIASLFGLEINVPGAHPVDARSAFWTRADSETIDAIRRLGIEVWSAPRFLAESVTGAALQVVEELFGVNETKLLIESLRRSYEPLVQELFGAGAFSYSEMADLLRRLLREQVNIRDLKLILEGVSEFCSLHPDKEDRTAWLEELHSFLRRVMARGIVSDALGPSGQLRTFTLDLEVENEFRSAISGWERSRGRPPLEPSLEASLRATAERMFHPVLERGAVPIVVLCAADIRLAVQEFFRHQLQPGDWLRTLAFEELDAEHKPESVGVIGVEAA